MTNTNADLSASPLLNVITQGDCLEVMRQIPDGSVDMILCDLPYGTTRNKWDSIISLDELWTQYERIIKERGAIVLTAAQPFTSALIMSNTKLFRYDLTWDKTQVTGFLNSKRMPLRKHEDIAVFYKKLPTYTPQFSSGEAYSIKRKHGTSNYGEQQENETHNEGKRYPTSIINIPQVRIKGGHPTQKPVALFEYLINTYSNEGDVILDNCIGSGTTAIAAINTMRQFIGIEQDAEYCEIARQRIHEALYT